VRKIFIIFACFAVMLSACVKAPVNQSAKNGNGSIAVNTPVTMPPPAEPLLSEPSANDEPQSDIPAIAVPSPAELSAKDKSQPNEPAADAISADVIEIKDKMFIAQTTDIYYNADDYLGKTLKYEGIFTSFTWEENGVTYYSVIRYGPGCCGNDGNAGFEVIWDREYPAENDWVEAVGVLEAYDEDGCQYLRIALTSLTVLDVRGEEYVMQ